MKVLQLSLFSLLLGLSAGVMAQGTPVPATDDTETVETTDLTIEDLTGDEKMDKSEMMNDGEKSTLTPPVATARVFTSVSLSTTCSPSASTVSTPPLRATTKRATTKRTAGSSPA